MKGLVLAAGRGSRINEITKGKNKCLLNVNGKPVVKYAVEYLCNIKEISECVVVVGYRAEDIMVAIGENVNGKPIKYCRQEKQLGLINAIEASVAALNGEDFMMILGDEFIINNKFQEAVNDFMTSEDLCKIGIIEVNDISLVKKTYSFKYDSKKNMVDFLEKPNTPYNNLMGTGNVIFKSKVMQMLERVPVNPIRGEKELVDLFNIMVKDAYSISSFIVGDSYINLNTKNDIELLRKKLE